MSPSLTFTYGTPNITRFVLACQPRNERITHKEVSSTGIHEQKLIRKILQLFARDLLRG